MQQMLCCKMLLQIKDFFAGYCYFTYFLHPASGLLSCSSDCPQIPTKQRAQSNRDNKTTSKALKGKIVIVKTAI